MYDYSRLVIGFFVGVGVREFFQMAQCWLGFDELSKARCALRTARTVQWKSDEPKVIDMGRFDLPELLNSAYREKLAYEIAHNDNRSDIQVISLEGHPDALPEDVVSEWVTNKRQAGYIAGGTALRGGTAVRCLTDEIL
jgi:hypothetical protein